MKVRKTLWNHKFLVVGLIVFLAVGWHSYVTYGPELADTFYSEMRKSSSEANCKIITVRLGGICQSNMKIPINERYSSLYRFLKQPEFKKKKRKAAKLHVLCKPDVPMSKSPELKKGKCSMTDDPTGKAELQAQRTELTSLFGGKGRSDNLILHFEVTKFPVNLKVLEDPMIVKINQDKIPRNEWEFIGGRPDKLESKEVYKLNISVSNISKNDVVRIMTPLELKHNAAKFICKEESPKRILICT